MGIILAKFKKEKTTTEVLEKLEERIQQIEKYSFSTQEQKKRFVGNFLAISIGIYVIAFLAFYFVYFPPTWKERTAYSVPLLIFPVFIIFLRKAFTWYFQRKLNKNWSQLSALRAEKRKILEQVMDKETYKVAVNLLARFGEKTNGTKLIGVSSPRAGENTSPALSGLTKRNLAPSNFTNQNILSTTPITSQTKPTSGPVQPISTLSSSSYGSLAMSRQLPFSPSAVSGQELRRRTHFPIINQQNKSVFERIVDVLIGDGPQDRFAMICKECFAHNGMALKEEFDYATFRCAFCNTLNPSRKARPTAPPLPIPGTPGRSFDIDSTDSSSESSDDESEKGTMCNKPIIKLSEATPPETDRTEGEAKSVTSKDSETEFATETLHLNERDRDICEEQEESKKDI